MIGVPRTEGRLDDCHSSALMRAALIRALAVRRENGNDDTSLKLGRERKEHLQVGRFTLAAKAKGHNSMSPTRGRLQGASGFTEGLDTADLQETKALLEALS